MKKNLTKKVLIALDYDPTAQKVAETGYSLAKAMNAEITLLHVISDPGHYSSPKHIKIMGFAGSKDAVPLKFDNVDELKKIAQYFLDNSKELLGDNTIQTLLKDGALAESIVKTAKELKVDIIIMGSNRRKWQQNMVIGSVMEKVLHHSSVPVLIIPTR